MSPAQQQKLFELKKIQFWSIFSNLPGAGFLYDLQVKLPDEKFEEAADYINESLVKYILSCSPADFGQLLLDSLKQQNWEQFQELMLEVATTMSLNTELGQIYAINISLALEHASSVLKYQFAL